MCTSCRCSGNSAFSWDIYLDMGFFFFWVFCTLHHADAPVFLGTFTQTPGLFVSGFCTACRCSGNSTFSWDIYLDMSIVFFQVFHTAPGLVLHFYMCATYLFETLTHKIICVHHADALDFPGTFSWTLRLLFSGFPHIPRTCASYLHEYGILM